MSAMNSTVIPLSRFWDARDPRLLTARLMLTAGDLRFAATVTPERAVLFRDTAERLERLAELV